MKDGLMIEVSNLTKKYAGQTAVSDVSFTVGSGEIVGLLGHNGAGKSTIMRILSCFMPATSGTVKVAGFDVFKDADEVRRRIGYMPENNPLHPEMRVREYLKFRARIKGLSIRRCRERVDAVTEMCGLTGVSKKIIGHLSKGFKQRVGLADALVHEPELVILDEPTIGLDPHQIRAVRQLIKEQGRDRTVLISTHILSEVELTCTHVVILKEGRMLAADSIAKLHERAAEKIQVVAEIAAPATDLRSCWEEMAEVEYFDVAPADGEFWRSNLTLRDGLDLRPEISRLCEKRGWPLRELTRSRHSLEDIYMRLTRREEEES